MSEDHQSDGPRGLHVKDVPEALHVEIDVKATRDGDTKRKAVMDALAEYAGVDDYTDPRETETEDADE